MFDGLGYVAALRGKGVDPAGKRVHLIGAGGVARAVALALAQAGAARISLHDIDAGRAQALAADLRAAFPGLRAEALDHDEYDRDIVANAAPLGMREGDPMPCDPAAIAATTVVSDVIPKPDITPFLAAARQRGCVIVTGKDMVQGQAALIAAYLGVPALHR